MRYSAYTQTAMLNGLNDAVVAFENGSPLSYIRASTYSPNGIRLFHSELVCDITPDTDKFFHGGKFDINAGLAGTFPRLAAFAKWYGQYQFRVCAFQYRSLLPRASSLASGSVTLSPSANVLDAPYASKRDAEGNASAISGKVTEDLLCAVDTNPNNSVNGGFRHIVYNSADLYDKHLTCLGAMQLIVDGAAANQTIGELWVHYEVDLILPRYKAPDDLSQAKAIEEIIKRIVEVENGLSKHLLAYSQQRFVVNGDPAFITATETATGRFQLTFKPDTLEAADQVMRTDIEDLTETVDERHVYAKTFLELLDSLHKTLEERVVVNHEPRIGKLEVDYAALLAYAQYIEQTTTDVEVQAFALIHKNAEITEKKIDLVESNSLAVNYEYRDNPDPDDLRKLKIARVEVDTSALATQANLQIVAVDVTQLRTDYNQHEVRLALAEASITNTDTALTAVTTTVNALGPRVGHLETSVNVAHDANTAQDTDIAALAGRCNAIEAEQLQQNSLLTGLTTELPEKVQDITVDNSLILTGTTTGNAKSFALGVNPVRVALQSDIARVDEDLAQNRASWVAADATLQGTIESTALDLFGLRTEYEITYARVETVEAEHAELTDEVAALRGAQVVMRTDLDDTLAQVQSTKTDLTGLEQQVNVHRADHVLLRADHDNLDALVATHYGYLTAEVVPRIDALKTTSDATVAKNAAQDDDIVALAARTGTLETQQAAQATRQEELQTAIGDMHGVNVTQTANITALSDQLGTTATQLANTQTTLMALIPENENKVHTVAAGAHVITNDSYVSFGGFARKTTMVGIDTTTVALKTDVAAKVENVTTADATTLTQLVTNVAGVKTVQLGVNTTKVALKTDIPTIPYPLSAANFNEQGGRTYPFVFTLRETGTANSVKYPSVVANFYFVNDVCVMNISGAFTNTTINSAALAVFELPYYTASGANYTQTGNMGQIRGGILNSMELTYVGVNTARHARSFFIAGKFDYVTNSHVDLKCTDFYNKECVIHSATIQYKVQWPLTKNLLAFP